MLLERLWKLDPVNTLLASLLPTPSLVPSFRI